MSKGRAYAIERIKHIIAAANTIGSYAKRGRSAFDSDSTVRDAVLYQLIVIGEASKATDHEIVWLTATQDVERLRADLIRALVRL